LGRSQFKASLGEKFAKPSGIYWLDVMTRACHPSYSGKYKWRRISVQHSLSLKQDPISKITNAKKTSGMAQMVACMPSKCKVLGSTRGTTKKKKKKRRELFLLKANLKLKIETGQ
jgi:hypothetical protein